MCPLISGIQQKGSILLQSLVAEQKVIDDMSLASQIAKALVTAMRKFHHDPDVLVEVSDTKLCVLVLRKFM